MTNCVTAHLISMELMLKLAFFMKCFHRQLVDAASCYVTGTIVFWLCYLQNRPAFYYIIVARQQVWIYKQHIICHASLKH